jgi:phosphoglycolate phosphatase
MIQTKSSTRSARVLQKTDAFFFDIDGTLLVTRDLVHWNALHKAMLQIYGIDTNLDGLTYHGKTDVAILRAALSRMKISDAIFYERLSRALAVVCEEVASHATEFDPLVCPAIPELLDCIASERRLLGVASGNLETVGWHKVAAAGLRKFFQFGSFGDHCEQRCDIFRDAVKAAQRRLGNSAAVTFVGDTPDDILAARRVNASVIAVSTGSFQFQELAALDPDICCESCAHLLNQWHNDLEIPPHLRQLSTSRIVG